MGTQVNNGSGWIGAPAGTVYSQLGGGPRTGYWLRTGHILATGNPRSASDLMVFPIIVPQTFTADRINVEVATATALSSAQLGIYLPDANGLPGALLLDAGNIATTTTGDKAITISQVIPAGLIYLACSSLSGGSGVATFRNIAASAGGSTPSPLFCVQLPSATTTQHCGYIMTGQAGALPSNFTSPPTSERFAPYVSLRAA